MQQSPGAGYEHTLERPAEHASDSLVAARRLGRELRAKRLQLCLATQFLHSLVD
jgi:hypothetical protein